MSRFQAWLTAAAAAAITTAILPAAAAAPQPSTNPSSTASPLTSTQPADAPPGHMQPLWRMADNTSADGADPNSIGEPGGYDPDELRAYLHLNGTGEGQTVAIVEAWNVEESVTKALASYNDWYGLKPACSDTVTTNCFPLTFVAPNGTREPVDPHTDGCAEACRVILSWQEEADLDVEVVHAIAPDAAITVVEASDDSNPSVMAALDHAGSLHPTVISNSYGTDEFDGEQALDANCQTSGPLCVFSSGDGGNPGEWPAANPAVLAVGGTTLDMDRTGQVRSEVAWPGSGGGISPFEPQPAYQASIPFSGGRGIPDVAFDADPNSGIATYFALTNPVPTNFPDFCKVIPFCNEFWGEIGGTSVGAPAWSAILATTGQQRAAKGEPPLTADQVHTAVYTKNAKGLADITLGANGFCGPICNAGPGYDLVTGQGSPRPGIGTYLAKQH